MPRTVATRPGPAPASSGLDKLDWQLLALLQTNARVTNTELARKLGLSPPGLYKRLKKLETQGVVRQYVALLNPEALGLDLLCFVSVSLAHHRRDLQGRMFPAIVLQPSKNLPLDSEDIQTVVQVLAEPAVSDRLQWVGVGGGDHPHVHGLFALAAEGAKTMLLQHAEQLCLRARRHLRNLVEKQRALVRKFEAALPSGLGARIGKAIWRSYDCNG